MTARTGFIVGGSTGTPNAINSLARGSQKYQWDIAKFVSVDSFVAGDTEKLIIIPARTFFVLHAVYADTTLALGGTPVFSLGDSSSGTLFVNASSNVTANTSFTIATASKIYDAANYVIVTLNNSTGTVATGKFTMIYELIDCSAGLGSGKPTF